MAESTYKNKALDTWNDKDVEQFLDDLFKPVPGLIRGSVLNPLKKAAKEDRNNNNKSDVLEWLVTLKGFLDLANEANELVDFEKLADCVDDMPFIKDKPAAKTLLQRTAKRIEDAQRLAEAQRLLNEASNK